jgi:hypothetical protein
MEIISNSSWPISRYYHDLVIECLNIQQHAPLKEISASVNFLGENQIGNNNSIFVRFEVFTAVTMKNVSSGILRCVALVRTDVSEERSPPSSG